MTPDLARFTRFARENPRMKYNSIMGLFFRKEGLLDSFHRLSANKAAGVDGVKKEDYADGLEDSIETLSGELQRGGYKPKPVRRVYIPKASGGRRPLGVPCFEDRIVQDRASQLLQAIWEPEFLDCSYGFRPRRSAHDALKRINHIIMKERTHWVVEADIKGFFDHVEHSWMSRFLEHRITDQRFVRTIQRFLKAGVMEDGAVTASEEGTPQGGQVSPVLSNIYLHYVLDTWFEKRFAPSCRGKAYLVRYCDDFVAFFECEPDAHRFQKELGDRLARFNLEVEPTKTKLLKFGVRVGARQGTKEKTRTFDFLGFTFYIGKSRNGYPSLKVKTARSRIVKKLKEVGTKLKGMRNRGTHAMLNWAAMHLRGHIQYYGVSDNMRSLKVYIDRVKEDCLFKWMNRRSQRKSYTWPQFRKLLRSVKLPEAKIVHCIYAGIGG